MAEGCLDGLLIGYMCYDAEGVVQILRNAWALLITKSEALCNRLSEA